MMTHSSFSIGEKDFLLDGEPFRILSGAIHFFRVHPDQWADRIRKARLMGLNTIETYVAWNAHEPRRGEWDATGANDLGAFLDAVAAEGMFAIVRPGPYICAEWANGGLPVWLTGDASIGLRRSEPGYLAEVGRYLAHVYDIVVPRQIDRGGNVILVQIENEYGAYGADKEYLSELVRMTVDAGVTVPLTTVDQPQPAMLRDGSLPGLHMTASFGSRAVERLQTLREFQPTGPLMSMEFWDGWFDWWGGYHHTTDPAAAAADLDELLESGASVNFYMFHGGTNFGLTNGANDKGRYRPITTSYDYDAPLDEAGNPTAKYDAFRAVIARHFGVPDEQPARAAAAPELTVELTVHGDWTRGGAEVGFETPPTFEDLGHDSALVRYAVDLPLFEGSAVLAFDEVRDRAWVRVDGVAVGLLDRARHDSSLVIPPGQVLELLVEDQGRVNYDIRIGETKGLIGGASLGGEPLTGWRVTPVDVEQAPDGIGAGGAPAAAAEIGPVALRGTFALSAASDLFLDTTGFENGYAFVNGFLLGRYSSAGPQVTLYVPAPVTRAGDNDLLVLELDHTTTSSARFVAAPVLGPLEE
ncbi:beta-galactosidase [Planococcus sp. APC 4015]|nr:beta-galactosidase [Planococcus sp. APC 4015]